MLDNGWGCNLYFLPRHLYRGSWVQNWTNLMKKSCFTDAFSSKNMFKEKWVDIIITWLISVYSWLFTPSICLLLTYFPVLDVFIKVCKCDMMKSTLNIWYILSICLELMQFVVALYTKCDLTGSYSTGKGFMKSTFPNQRVLLCSMPPVLLFMASS